MQSDQEAQEFDDLQQRACLYDRASTGAVMWPMLRDVVKMNQTRNERKGKDGEETGTGKIWDGVSDWFV